MEHSWWFYVSLAFLKVNKNIFWVAVTGFVWDLSLFYEEKKLEGMSHIFGPFLISDFIASRPLPSISKNILFFTLEYIPIKQ
jgi:hypothetical protein